MVFNVPLIDWSLKTRMSVYCVTVRLLITCQLQRDALNAIGSFMWTFYRFPCSAPYCPTHISSLSASLAAGNTYKCTRMLRGIRLVQIIAALRFENMIFRGKGGQKFCVWNATVVVNYSSNFATYSYCGESSSPLPKLIKKVQFLISQVSFPESHPLFSLWLPRICWWSSIDWVSAGACQQSYE
jgi:hypothetical protein